jgi:hypothetical protein
MAVIQDLYKLPVFNTVTPSSEGAAGAPTFAKPPNGNAVIDTIFDDAASEIVADAQWIVQAGQ